MKHSLLKWLLVAFLAAACSATAQTGVKITTLDDRLRVEIDGSLFTEYYFKGVPKPFLYPIIGPGNAALTRNFPMKQVPGETQDHPHHRALFYGHGNVNGIDFWAEGAKSGKTVHDEFVEVKNGDTTGIIRSRNRLVTVDNKVLGTDERTLRIHKTPHGPMIDFEITHHASHGDLVFQDTKEGTMAIRVAETLVQRHSQSKKNPTPRKSFGNIVNSEGVRDGATWGRRAKWVDYYGPVDGKTVGIAMFDHPKNPRFPTWWHVRDYGLFAANPFGVHDFERLENPAAGDLKVAAGKSVTFRYRLFFHAGDEKAAHIAERYEEYAGKK
ncbi:MAG: PmoA family protein [Verrucomicrobia bacterium]|nr:PmoA family protein [Verrucomicrobiota bacterium]